MREGGGIGIAIGVMILMFLALLPFLLVVALYVFFTIYAITKGSTFAGSTLNVGLVFAGIAVITAAFLGLLGAGISALGRALNPRRARDGSPA